MGSVEGGASATPLLKALIMGFPKMYDFLLESKFEVVKSPRYLCK